MATTTNYLPNGNIQYQTAGSTGNSGASSSSKANPYMDQMAAGITQQMTDNWTRNLAPSNNGGAMAAGGFGGSRQGVVEANGLNDLNRSLGQNLTNMYGADYANQQNLDMQNKSLAAQSLAAQNSYNLGLGNLALGNKTADNNLTMGQGNLALGNKTADQNYALGNKTADQNYALGNKTADNNYLLGQGNLNLQGYQAANNYDLGLRGSDLGFATLDANINNSNFAKQLSAINLGMNAYNTMGDYNTQATNAATTVQNAPLNYFNSASDKTNGVANGYGSQTSTQQNPGNAALGFLGGAQLGNQIYKSF